MKTSNNDFFGDSGYRLDVDEQKIQEVTNSMPHTLETEDDIKQVLSFLAEHYRRYKRLYRGHASAAYTISSTIARFTSQDIVVAERIGYDYFREHVFQDSWLKHKLDNTDERLFVMSIGRHLGLPCRLIDVTASLETAVWFAVMNPQYCDKDGEVILFLLDTYNPQVIQPASPFDEIPTGKIAYAHEAFLGNGLDELPLGEQRRFVQNGHFLWVGDDDLMQEQSTIEKALPVMRFKIPASAKLNLAKALFRDVYSGCAYRSQIEKINSLILKHIKSR